MKSYINDVLYVLFISSFIDIVISSLTLKSYVKIIVGITSIIIISSPIISLLSNNTISYIDANSLLKNIEVKYDNAKNINLNNFKFNEYVIEKYSNTLLNGLNSYLTGLYSIDSIKIDDYENTVNTSLKIYLKKEENEKNVTDNINSYDEKRKQIVNEYFENIENKMETENEIYNYLDDRININKENISIFYVN